MDRKLCLSKSNKILGGVCGGIAEYFNVDATLIRIVWVLFAFVLWFFPLATLYIICWAIMPYKKDQ